MNISQPKAGSVSRYVAISVLSFLLFGIVFIQLLNLQVRSGEENVKSSEMVKTKSVAIKGARGSIYDRNGLLIAHDVKSYDITFYRDPTIFNNKEFRQYGKDQHTHAMETVIGMVEANGGSTIGGFYLKQGENGAFYLDFGSELPDVNASRESQWRDNMDLSADDYPVDKIYETLCARYGIDPAKGFEHASKVLSIWQVSRMTAFLGTPSVIASNVPFNVVAQIAAYSDALTGFNVVESTRRVYPRGELTGHLSGYIAKIPDRTLKDYTSRGYDANDLVGVTGVEYTLEDQLTGNSSERQGYRLLEVDNRNRPLRTVDELPASSGNNVRLTIDLYLQNVTYEALKKNIETSYAEEKKLLEAATPEATAAYEKKVADRGGREIQFAGSGAAIVMDVRSGDVLSQVSYPGYDPQVFIGGISEEDYKKLGDENPLKPLYNRAISSRFPPGSIFKMATGLAALMENAVTPTEQIDDEGYFNKYVTSGHGPVCWTKHPSDHQNQDIRMALLHSCNYYFYEVSDRLGIDRLYAWTSRLGLTSKTGIELPQESTSIVGNREMLYDPTRSIDGQRTSKPLIVANAIKARLREAGEASGLTLDEERLDRTVARLFELVSEPTEGAGTKVRNIYIEVTGLASSVISQRDLVNQTLQYLNEIRWTPTETIMTGIGQSITGLTPISVARYISAIANGGTVYEAHIVDAVVAPDGKTVVDKQPTVVSQLTNAEWALEHIQAGMHGVLSPEDGGTGEKRFRDFPYTSLINAKTGTAQTANNIDIENTAWFTCYVPNDAPEIAIVVVIENGYAGLWSSDAAKEIMRAYLDRKNKPVTDDAPRPGTFLDAPST